jgi:hypothetical protein
MVSENIPSPGISIQQRLLQFCGKETKAVTCGTCRLSAVSTCAYTELSRSTAECNLF